VSARLALVPPSADAPANDAPASAPFDVMPLSAVKGAGSARFRRVLSAFFATGCALFVAAPLLAPVTHNASLAGWLFGALFLLASGLPLFGLVVVERTAAAARALVTAAVWLALAIGLTGPAHRVAIEAHVAAHMEELDALATEIRAMHAAPTLDDPQGTARVWERFGDRLRPLGINRVAPVDGGMLFHSSLGTGYTLIRADGVPGPGDACANPRLRFLGGRWFERTCR